VTEFRTDESILVAALVCGTPGLSRNRNYELLSSEAGRRARRRAAFLRSIARDIDRVWRDDGTVTIERGTFARGGVRVMIHHREFARRAYLTEDEIALIARAFPLAARVFDVTAEAL
jgi:hypothetical protein